MKNLLVLALVVSAMSFGCSKKEEATTEAAPAATTEMAPEAAPTAEMAPEAAPAAEAAPATETAPAQ